MRAVAQDRRLEAIAGPPVLTVAAPVWDRIGDPSGTTVVVVGQPTYLAGATLSGRLLVNAGLGRVYYYVRDDGTRGLFGGIESHGVTADGLHWLACHILPGEQYGIGGIRSNDVPGYRWSGALRGVAYGRVLAGADAMRVARHLAATLHAGESSLSLSLSLSLTHTQGA